MFTADSFQTIITQQIETAATEASQGNWILGSFAATFSSPNSALLAEQARTLYLTNYVASWENILSGVQLLTPKNLDETDALVKVLSRNNSPLAELLKTINQNTAFSPILTASPKLAALNAFMMPDKQHNTSLTGTVVALGQLHNYLQTILIANDTNKSAWEASSAHMANNNTDALTQLFKLAALSPEPIHAWLSMIATKSWHYSLEAASHYVETQWQNKIIKNYKANLSNRFPFYLESNQEVGLNEFSQLLGIQGSYSTFYKSFLLPFVDVSAAEWKWKTIDNEKIFFSNSSILQLQNIDKVQHAFFTPDNNALSIKFVLQPVAIQRNTKSIHLDVNGQTFRYNRTLPPIAETLNWPGNKDKAMTALNLLTSKNQTISSTFKGDWGWFRLVEKSQKKIINPKELLLSFEVEGHKANYLLFTQGNENPFLLNFQLPEQL